MQLRGWEEEAKEKLENDEAEYDKGASKERMASATRPRPKQCEAEQEEEQSLTRKYRFNHYLY